MFLAQNLQFPQAPAESEVTGAHCQQEAHYLLCVLTTTCNLSLASNEMDNFLAALN